MQDWKIEADRIAAENEAAMLADYNAALAKYQQQVEDIKASTEALRFVKADANGNITVKE